MALEILNYNFIPLQILMTKEISRKHVYSDDKTTYLHTRWLFDVTTAVNPLTLGALGLGGLNGDFSQNVAPSVIDFTLRIFLNVPRRALVFSQSSDGGATFNVVLNVPANPDNLATSNGLGGGVGGNQKDPTINPLFQSKMLTDCQNGPIVEDFNIIRDHAGKTWMVQIRIVACVRECPFGSTSKGFNDNPIISNRFSRRMVTEGEKGGYLSYIETEGEVTFDSAWLLQLGKDVATPGVIKWGRFPDQYRFDLFQPIPANSHRSDIDVTQAPNGFSYRYSFRDQERHFNTLPACYLEVYKTEGFSQTSFASAAVAGVLGVLPQAVNGIVAQINAAGNQFAGPAGANAAAPAAAAGGVAGAIGTAAIAALNVIKAQIPKFSMHMLVRAWGTRDMPKWALLTQAMAIVTANLSTLRNVELTITYELTGKYVEVNLTNTTGPEQIKRLLAQQITGVFQSAKNFIAQAAAGNLSLNTLLGNGVPSSIQKNQDQAVATMMNTPENDPNNWYTQIEADSRTAFATKVANDPKWKAAFPGNIIAGGIGSSFGNVQPPNDNYTRGSLLCNMIAQALHDPCTPPPCPPEPGTRTPIGVCPPKAGRPNPNVTPPVPDFTFGNSIPVPALPNVPPFLGIPLVPGL